MPAYKSYYVEMSSRGNTSRKYGFRAPQALYGDIRNDLGVIEVSERTYGSVQFGIAGKSLPRLRLGLGGEHAD